MRAPFVLLLSLFVVAAGCVTPPSADEAAPGVVEPQAAPPKPPAPVATPPASVGAGPHVHDYWLGKERVTLFEDTIEQDPLAAFDATLYQVWIEKRAAVGGSPWRLPDGTIVFEGTGVMELTASWTDPAMTGLAVAYRSAASDDEAAAVALPNGEVVAIDVTPGMTDMPHSKTSRWSFMFTPEDPGVALASFDLRVDVVRVDDVEAFPGHPELFTESDSLLLHDERHAFDQVNYGARAPNLVLTGEFGESEITPTWPIPMDTQWIEAMVHVQAASATPGEIVDVRFFYHGADTSFIDYPYLKPVEGDFASGHMVFRFPVIMEQTDSPYAGEGQSQWRFFVEPVTSVTGADGPCGGCADTQFEFDFEVVAWGTASDGPFSEAIERGEG